MDIKKLAQKIENIEKKQDLILAKLDELKIDKDKLDLVMMDSAQELENLYEEAKKEVIKTGKASTSYLQRKLGIGYEKACVLIDRLEDEMIIGESQGAKPREVLVKSKKELEGYVRVDPMSEDDLYNEAKKITIESGRITTSYLQRKLGTGYARSARLMDMLEEEGIIEAGQGSKPRKVLVKK